MEGKASNKGTKMKNGGYSNLPQTPTANDNSGYFT